MFSPAGRGDGMVAARNFPCLAWVHRQPSPHPTYNRSCESIDRAARAGACADGRAMWDVCLPFVRGV